MSIAIPWTATVQSARGPAGVRHDAPDPPTPDVHVGCAPAFPEGHSARLVHLQVKCLVVLGSPVVALGLGCELPLLVALMGSNHGDFDKGAEHARRLPLQVVGCHDW